MKQSLLFLALKYFKYHYQTWSLITVFLLNNSSHFSPAAPAPPPHVCPALTERTLQTLSLILLVILQDFYSCLQFPPQALGC